MESNKYMCCLCKKVYGLKNSYKCHLKKRQTCPTCNKVVCGLVQLREHRLEHIHGKGCQCPSGLHQHQHNQHPFQQQQLLQPQQQVQQQQPIEQHMQQHQPQQIISKMTKDREGPAKSNKNTKKHPSSTSSFSGYLQNQKDIISRLNTELHNSSAEKQQIKLAAMEKNKCIQELQKSIEERDTDIKKLELDLSAAREENTKTLQDFYIFKEKFFELETHYDTECLKQNRKIDNLRQQLETRQSQEIEHVRELSQYCEDLKQQLHEQKQSYAKLGLDYAELLDKCERNQHEFVRQQTNFENFKKQVDVEKMAYSEKLKNDLAVLKQKLLTKGEHFALESEKLKYDLLEKDELIKQCIKDKDIVEEEKNRKIQELNYKISQIEKVFGQPTKTVAPILSLPNTPQTDSRDQQTAKTANNVAITKPQIRQECPEIVLSNQSVSNINNQLPETSNRLRTKKMQRSSHTSGQNANLALSNNTTSKKRGIFNKQQLLRNPSPPPRERASFSTPSTEDDCDDDDIFIPQWGPGHYIPETETDASEGFIKPKRFKK